jgi:hypothetical protein
MAGDAHDDRLRRAWDVGRQFPEAVTAINRVADGLRTWPADRPDQYRAEKWRAP